MEKSNDPAVMIRKFIQDLLKNWFFIALFLGVTLAAAVAYVKFSAKTYKLGTSILIRPDRSKAIGARGVKRMR